MTSRASAMPLMSEVAIYEHIARHINTNYPQLRGLYHFDLSGVNNSSHYTRSLYSRLNSRGWPDFTLHFPTFVPGTIYVYHGFMLEVKIEGTQLKRTKDVSKPLKGDYKVRKAGDWWDIHIEEQAAVLDKLREHGWIADFGVGLEDCLQKLDSYLAGFHTPEPEDGSVF